MDCQKALNLTKACRDILDEISEGIESTFDSLISEAQNNLDEAIEGLEKYMENIRNTPGSVYESYLKEKAKGK